MSRLPALLLALILAGMASEWTSNPHLQAAAQQTIQPSSVNDGSSGSRLLQLPPNTDHYANLDLPIHFRERNAERFDNTPRDNPVTDFGATLGRVLFYDTRLSANDSISCASCHVQSWRSA